jgi:hypothetical protein
MPINYKARSEGGTFTALPSGTYLAVCDIVAELGIQPGSGLYPSPKAQIYLRFEVPDERVAFTKDGKDLEGPAVIGKPYTASMNEKANLRKDLESWRGKAFTDEEAESFDIASVLGKGCMLSVTEAQRNGKTYTNITGIGKLVKGATCPKAENGPFLYSSDTTDSYHSLPKWLRDKIDTQMTPKQATAQHKQLTEIEDDDIPF